MKLWNCQKWGLRSWMFKFEFPSGVIVFMLGHSKSRMIAWLESLRVCVVSAWDIKLRQPKEIQQSANKNNFLFQCRMYPKPSSTTPQMKTTHADAGTWAREEKNVFALKLNKLWKFFLRSLCCCCTCDGISVSRGKKSFVQVMLLCTFSRSGVCLLLPFFVSLKEKRRSSELTLCEKAGRQRRRKNAKAGYEQKGMLAMSQQRGDFSVFQFKLSPWERVRKWDEDDANFGMIVVSLSSRTSPERQTFLLFCRNRQVSFSRLIKL